MAKKKTVESSEFMYLPLGSIIVEEQIRSKIDTESESFKALMSSIKDKGVLEPVLVTPKGDNKYLLIFGERRYLAAQKLGFETIPVRNVNTATQKDEILVLQLIENLQREDLNPIDQANGILDLIQARHPDPRLQHSRAGKGYNLDGVMSILVDIQTKPEKLSEEITCTVHVISEITRKSYSTLFRTLSLLKLVPKIQDAIAAGILPVSQGYIFAANLGSPDFFTIFDEIMEKPVTNAKLEKMLTAYKKPIPTDPKPIPMKIKVAGLQAAKSYFEEKTGMYTKNDLQTLIAELQAFLDSVKKQAQTAPEVVPVNKPGGRPIPQV
jgi:ParB family transcriptional regulator, chromosome partitioning protein